MARLLEQPSRSSLSSSTAYSSSCSEFSNSSSNSVSRSSLARVSSLKPRAGSSSSNTLTWGRRKQTKRMNKADHSIPASVVMEESGASKSLVDFLEQTGLCRENAILGYGSSSSIIGRAPGETVESTTRFDGDGGITNGRLLPAQIIDITKGFYDESNNVTAAEIVIPIREKIPITSSPTLQQDDVVWLQMREEALVDSKSDPALASYLYSTILAHKSLERSLAFHLGNKLSSATFLSTQLVSVFIETIMGDPSIQASVRRDIIAVKERDPACVSFAHCLLNFKGFLALQAHRVAHRLWTQGRESLALAMQSRVSEVFQVDIHPGARIGSGVLFDHASGVVVGETAVIGNNVSILHRVTLGGTGSIVGDRHPKIGDGVLIGAGATILGPIRVGEGAKIGAGSLVLTDIPPHTTAVGNPARLLGGKDAPKKSNDTPSETMDHTSFIGKWSDYVI